MIHLIHTVDEADQVLSQGEILIYPTETLWGMGADLTHIKAIQKIFHLKQRSHSQPISLLVRDMEMAKQYAVLKEPILTHIATFWPGPVTFVLPALPTVPQEIHAGTHYVGLRCSSHPFLQQLMQKRTQPITSTSANISQKNPIPQINLLADTFGDIHCVASDEVLKGPGSTVVKWNGQNLTCLREGNLPFSQLVLENDHTPTKS